ncbi:transposase [Blautia sp.]|uniref:transposase n=1 Tax=Blautia sp. TaxID=1955243 RepID=UPI003522744F
MKENLIHYCTCVCNINYHMVWSVKYRRKILNAEVEDLQEAFRTFSGNKKPALETVGSVSEENIRRYIEHQSKAY